MICGLPVREKKEVICDNIHGRGDWKLIEIYSRLNDTEFNANPQSRHHNSDEDDSLLGDDYSDQLGRAKLCEVITIAQEILENRKEINNGKSNRD